VIRELEGRPVWKKIDYIIVPAAKLDAAKELAERHKVNSGKIVDMETRKALKAKTDAQKQPGAVKRSEGK
jgi:hypothetical protein